ncbi:helix-turn-helix domain-containing protein [Acidithiobacillus thiooxidans]|uniref:helix-turn-helix domain-containing protein n=2 Tax=Acidithiobacillus TaxID=119977 RepID=UPI001C06516A|nr:helix-turn-helix domain-containing protein [Acidithiobacillus thiooxidans]
MMQSISKLLKTKQAAAFLGVSESFLEKDRVQSGRVPFIKFGMRKGIRYREEDLQAFISSSRFRSTSEYSQEKSRGK